MTRAEHLAWCKQRAIAELPDLGNAVASMASDLGKHPETRTDPVLIVLGIEATARGPEAVREWIEGFN